MPRCNIRRVVSLRAQLSLFFLIVECVGHGTSNMYVKPRTCRACGSLSRTCPTEDKPRAVRQADDFGKNAMPQSFRKHGTLIAQVAWSCAS